MIKNLFFRLISALLGGSFGTLFAVIIYFSSLYFLGNEQNPLTSFVLIFMIFTGSLVANLSTGAILTFAQPEKYTRKNTMLWHAFLLNIFLFLVAFPFYTIIENIQAVAIFHLISSAFASNVIYEMFTEKNAYALTGLYGSLFGAFFIFIVSIFINVQEDILNIIIFILLPLIWIVLTLFTLIVEYLYTLFYKVSHIMFFDIHKDL